MLRPNDERIMHPHMADDYTPTQIIVNLEKNQKTRADSQLFEIANVLNQSCSVDFSVDDYETFADTIHDLKKLMEAM